MAFPGGSMVVTNLVLGAPGACRPGPSQSNWFVSHFVCSPIWLSFSISEIFQIKHTAWKWEVHKVQSPWRPLEQLIISIGSVMINLTPSNIFVSKIFAYIGWNVSIAIYCCSLYRVVFWLVHPKEWASVRLHLNPFKKVLSIGISLGFGT